jgi:transcriptional regulator GlxA family with amidase domain
VLAVPPSEELDIVGPWDVFATANNAVRGRKRGYNLELVTTGDRRFFQCNSGLTLSAKYRYKDVQGGVDTLIVTGGAGALRSHSRSVLDWIRKIGRKTRRVASVCTGAFLLAEAGLLDGRRATTHWMFTKQLSAKYPEVDVDPNPIFVRDKNLYTSAGVTAGMDLALALVEEDLGSAIALRVAQVLVLFLRRPAGQAQFSISLSTQASDFKPLRDLQAWIADNLEKDLSIESLASRAAMSERNFARVFVRELGTTPAHYVEQMRLEAARRELELTNKNLKQVALASGFRSAEVMRRAFLRCLRTSPSSYRDHFA